MATLGAAGGVIVSAGLLRWLLSPLIYAGILGAMLVVMQLVGARRYAVWTFCLTFIALDLGQRIAERPRGFHCLGTTGAKAGPWATEW